MLKSSEIRNTPHQEKQKRNSVPYPWFKLGVGQHKVELRVNTVSCISDRRDKKKIQGNVTGHKEKLNRVTYLILNTNLGQGGRRANVSNGGLMFKTKCGTRSNCAKDSRRSTLLVRGQTAREQ